jgi:hypothetical protein
MPEQDSGDFAGERETGTKFMILECKKCGLRGEFDKEPENWFRFSLRKGTPQCSEPLETIILCEECGKLG